MWLLAWGRGCHIPALGRHPVLLWDSLVGGASDSAALKPRFSLPDSTGPGAYSPYTMSSCAAQAPAPAHPPPHTTTQHTQSQASFPSCIALPFHREQTEAGVITFRSSVVAEVGFPLRNQLSNSRASVFLPHHVSKQLVAILTRPWGSKPWPLAWTVIWPQEPLCV